MKKIAHITSVHKRYDPRICYKQSQSLSNQYDTSLIVMDGKGDEKINKLKIVDLGKPKNRILRIIQSPFKLYFFIRKNKFELIHIHDPELIFLGFFLKIINKRVIFDSHEDFPKQLLTKDWLVWPINYIFSTISNFLEKYLYHIFDYVIVADEDVSRKFKKYGIEVECIKNYPMLTVNPLDWKDRNNEVSYLGALSFDRGTDVIVDSLELINQNININLIGSFANNSIKEYVKASHNFKRVKLWGYQKIKDAYKITRKSKIGLIPLKNIPNYEFAEPTKLYEYMMLEIPVICTNIPLWSKIIKQNKCGIMVENNVEDISKAINFLMNNEKTAKQMGKNGRTAILKKLNWKVESKKLLKIYKKVLSIE